MATVIESIPADAEVLPIVSSDSGAAFRAGVREAESRTRRGYPYECVGVAYVEYEGSQRTYGDVSGMIRDDHIVSLRRMVYKPILIPA